MLSKITSPSPEPLSSSSKNNELKNNHINSHRNRKNKICLQKHLQMDWSLRPAGCIYSGAPNENIVENNLNIALLNVFFYLNGRYRHIFIPEKFFIYSDFLAESLVIQKIIGIKTYFFENFSQKKGSRKF